MALCAHFVNGRINADFYYRFFICPIRLIRQFRVLWFYLTIPNDSTCVRPGDVRGCSLTSPAYSHLHTLLHTVRRIWRPIAGKLYLSL